MRDPQEEGRAGGRGDWGISWRKPPVLGIAVIPLPTLGRAEATCPAPDHPTFFGVQQDGGGLQTHTCGILSAFPLSLPARTADPR
jgi:hypothetical protein